MGCCNYTRTTDYTSFYNDEIREYLKRNTAKLIEKPATAKLDGFSWKENERRAYALKKKS